VPNAEAHVANVHWPEPGSLPALPSDRRRDIPRRRSARGLWLPVAAVALAAMLSVWASGLLDNRARPPAEVETTRSSGLVFGLCSDGGLTNCIASGDSFYIGGKTVRIAGIEAPQLYGAACPREAHLGRQSALKLQALLNSGELEMTRAGQDLDRYGLLLRHVAIDGRDVGRAMVGARLAREIGTTGLNWC
jgi:endonuclease YncB( thermonuclease family)